MRFLKSISKAFSSSRSRSNEGQTSTIPSETVGIVNGSIQTPRTDVNAQDELDVDLEIRPWTEADSCPVCFELVGADAIEHTPCGHVVCRECAKANCRFLVSNGNSSVNCIQAGCPQQLSYEQIYELLRDDEVMIRKLERFMVDSVLRDMDDVIYCPRAGCCTPMVTCPGAADAECVQCNYAFCTKCLLESHPGVSCKRFRKWHEKGTGLEDKMFRKWKKKAENVKPCPKCKAMIHKISGCNMMTCCYCKFGFCWLCGGKMTSKHFDGLNPFGCAGQQYSESTNMPKRAVIRLGLGIGYAVAVPLALAASPLVGGYFLADFAKSKTDAYRRRRKQRKAQRRRFRGFNITENTVITGPFDSIPNTPRVMDDLASYELPPIILEEGEGADPPIESDSDSLSIADSDTETDSSTDGISEAGEDLDLEIPVQDLASVDKAEAVEDLKAIVPLAHENGVAESITTEIQAEPIAAA
eukprot:TRINITY_DN288_c0_g1_i2.p1 TRINITY_DN288_c0_g1~~TRINITY_DN288_c0_g1_i2.p1  ORF type:complete len:470 (-),score=101.04 TRINITY_DN288_c0_g1_i2:292-1701(-)